MRTNRKNLTYEALTIAQQISDEIAANSIPFDETGILVTCVVLAVHYQPIWMILIKHADEALYQAKGAG